MPIVGTSREGAIAIRELRWGTRPKLGQGREDGYKAINACAESPKNDLPERVGQIEVERSH